LRDDKIGPFAVEDLYFDLVKNKAFLVVFIDTCTWSLERKKVF